MSTAWSTGLFQRQDGLSGLQKRLKLQGGLQHTQTITCMIRDAAQESLVRSKRAQRSWKTRENWDLGGMQRRLARAGDLSQGPRVSAAECRDDPYESEAAFPGSQRSGLRPPDSCWGKRAWRSVESSGRPRFWK